MHRCNIRNYGFIHGNADIISTALRFFNFISCQKEERRRGCLQIDEPHRGSAFDSPGLASIASYPGLIRSVGGQRHRCCASLISSAMNPLAIIMFSRKKLNTYGVESPCECLPRVGSFLANPGLSKEQLVPSCVVITFIMVDSFIKILA